MGTGRTSFLRQLRKLFNNIIQGPAVPAHLLIQFINRNINCIKECPQHLSQSKIGVAQFFFPALQPCLFSLSFGQISQRVFHVFGEKSCFCQEVTLRRGVTPPLACVAEYCRIKLSSVMIRTCIAPAQVPGSVGILWATGGTPGIPIINTKQRQKDHCASYLINELFLQLFTYENCKNSKLESGNLNGKCVR
jgi:hypothetical protein